MSTDRISLSNGAIDRTLQSNPTEEVRPSPQTRHSRAAKVDDAISLSDGARNAHRLAAMMDQSRTSRLNEVRDALANGTYKVAATDIAQKMIELHTR